MTQQAAKTANRATNAEPAVEAGRYTKLGELGGGGMAVVYRVEDAVTGRQLALKRPRSGGSDDHRRRSHELFAREFHTLIQLAHPRIVEVYDYAVDEQGPYYTMELLDGGDLQGLTPVDYRRACAIAGDVCSALSLLHSRRIVHRDLSPRNIRCTNDGLAKLIDFGAMTQMGPSKELVGTPVYCAPEVLNMQALDARTDLYALGASLYYALTQHHPYPARDFSSLPNAWRFGLARPSELVHGIPEALDALVLDLLQLQPDARPSNAAEVMARLSAIAGTALDEQLLVAQAYLATPAFVGREAELGRVKAKAGRTLSKRGGAVLIEGPAGSGRSRFLEASLLDSKLMGVTVVRADADDGERDYGVVRRVLCQLQQLLPQLTRESAEPVLPVLGHIVPELIAGRDVSLVPTPDLATLRPQLQSAVQQVLLGVAARVPLLLAIDDLHAIDEPSTAAIGLIAQHIRRAPFVILGTAVSGATPQAASAFKLFADTASKLKLRNLTQEEAHDLLASVFGASRALDALTHRLYALSAGSPRDLLRLAQHLVDSGSARYHAGAWSLPADFDAAQLPSSLAQLLSSRLSLLSTGARDLARTLALCPERSFSVEECAQLSEHERAAAVLADIEQLTKADVLRYLAGRVVLADRAWVPLLEAGLAPAHAGALHLRLARVFEVRQNEGFRHAQHLLRGGEIEHALDMFVANALASRSLTDRNPEAFHELLLLLPADWFETYEQVLLQLQRRQRPKRDEIAILLRVATMGGIAGTGQAQTKTLTLLLKQACGLSDWEQLDPALPPGARLHLALERAQARYLASSEDERFADPPTAIREIATAVRMTVAISALSMDLKALQSITSLQPLIPLAPALWINEQLVRGVQARLSGRVDRAREVYRDLLQRLESPEGTGLPVTHLLYVRLMVMNGLAVLDAASGLATCLNAADQIEKHTALQSNAWLIRMVHQLWQGNTHEAERCRKQFDVTRIQNSAAQGYDSVQLTWQLTAYVAMEDLTRIKRTLHEVAPLAAKFPAFRTVISYGEAEYQRIRGDSSSALKNLDELMRSCEAGAHQTWPQLAAAHVRALDAASDSTRAAQQGLMYLAEAKRADLGPSALNWISLALCVVEARLGQAGAALTAQTLIEHCLATGATGLPLGLAYEARARVAMLLADADSCERYRALCEQAFAPAGNPALSAKLEKLKREAQKRHFAPQAPLLEAAQRGVAASVIQSRLNACSDAAARAHALLALLAQQSGAREGYLYQVGHGGPSRVASLGDREPDPGLDGMVREYILAELQAGGQVTGESELSVQTSWTAFGETAYRPVLLSHYVATGTAITGLAVLVVAADRAFVYPGEVAAQISQMMQDADDLTGLLIVED